MEKNKIPDIDLSKYCDAERLDSSIEQIILNGLIAYECDVKKVKKHFNLDDNTVNKVYIKYYTQLCKIIDIRNKNSDADETINTVVELYKQHIDEVKNIVDNNKATKLLSDKVTRSLNSITDRLMGIKEQQTRAYDSTVNALNNQIIKQKQLECVESGKIEDNTDYSSNQESVADKLITYKKKTQNKRVSVTEPGGPTYFYNSAVEVMEDHPDWNLPTFYHALQGLHGEGTYKGYKIAYVEE